MKKLIAILCSAVLTMMMFVSIVPITLFAAEGDVVINETNFPDAIFRNYVSKEFDTVNDGILTKDECDAVNGIDVGGKTALASLKGIEYFTNLDKIVCYSTKLTTLDVSKNTALNYLDCGYTKVAELDISKNTALEYLDCRVTALTSLDVSKNTMLLTLDCSITSLTSLDVSKNTMLETLDCGMTDISELDTSKNILLEELDCAGTSITKLDVNYNTKLKNLICYDTNITELNVSHNTELNNLYCSFCHLSKLILPEKVKQNKALYFTCMNQTIKTPVNGMTDDGKYIVDMKTIVGAENLDKVLIIDTDEYTYNSETGIVTFLIDNPTQFTYLFDIGIKVTDHTGVESTIKMDVNVTLTADYSEAEQLLSDFLLLNPEDYANYDEVRDAVVAINLAIEDNLPVSEQSTVDGYAKSIRAELDKLQKIVGPSTPSIPITPAPETATKENILYVVLTGILMLAGATLIYKKHKEE